MSSAETVPWHIRRGSGLYAAKPAFQRRLRRLADELARRNVDPDVLTVAAVGCGTLGGGAIALSAATPWLLALVPPLAMTRLALNALDGMVAHRRGVARPWGQVLNELGDRVADVGFLMPLALVPGISQPILMAALVAVILASYVGVTAQAAGGPRQFGGVMGKADRMVWLSIASLGSWCFDEPAIWQLLSVVLLVGALVTIVQRARSAHAAL